MAIDLVIDVQNVSKSFGGLMAVRNCSLTVARGWPALEGGLPMIPGTDFYPGDDPAKFPPSHVQMRRLRSACS